MITLTEKYEIRIFAKDKTKIVYFGENFADWEDMYHCAGLVIDDEPDQLSEGELFIGQIKTDLPFEEVVRIMIEDAGLMRSAGEEALKDPAERTELLE